MKKFLVYIHHNLINHKVYVGITCQINPNRRWKNGNGYKSNKYFTSAILKYGWENFEHIIVAKDISKESACEIEKELIKLYNSDNKEHGYNISSGGEISGFKDGRSSNPHYGLLFRKEKMKKAHDKFKKEHPAYSHDYYKKNKERLLEQHKEYVSKNKERINQKQRERRHNAKRR